VSASELVPPGGSTPADNPPPSRSEWPDDSRAGAVTDVPLLSRTAHDRGHLSRGLPDPAQGRPVRVLRVDERRTVPVHEGPQGPELVYDEQPSWPEDAIYLGEADGVAYAALRGPRSLSIGGRGAPTTIERAGWVQRDPDSGSEVFPRTDPAVIMLVHDGGDRCVLGRQAVWPPGRFSILAGFVEPGESAEAAVAREVAEEVGIAVTDVRYVASQPWPFPQSLMLGFVARATEEELKIDHDEIEEARWFSREELRTGTGPQALPPTVSIARHILDRWVAGEFS
jgi:NAD+ diphosphatase